MKGTLAIALCWFGLGAGCIAPRPGEVLAPNRTPKVASFAQMDLRGESLAGVSAPRIDLSQANATDVSFRNAFLPNAMLDGIRAARADFRGADLSSASMRWAELPGADLRGAILKGTILYRADLRGASLGNADLTGARFDWAHLKDTHFESSRGLSRALLETAACWDEKTTWPDGWEPEEATRSCHLHC